MRGRSVELLDYFKTFETPVPLFLAPRAQAPWPIAIKRRCSADHIYSLCDRPILHTEGYNSAYGNTKSKHAPQAVLRALQVILPNVHSVTSVVPCSYQYKFCAAKHCIPRQLHHGQPFARFGRPCKGMVWPQRSWRCLRQVVRSRPICRTGASLFHTVAEYRSLESYPELQTIFENALRHESSNTISNFASRNGGISSPEHTEQPTQRQGDAFKTGPLYNESQERIKQSKPQRNRNPLHSTMHDNPQLSLSRTGEASTALPTWYEGDSAFRYTRLQAIKGAESLNLLSNEKSSYSCLEQFSCFWEENIALFARHDATFVHLSSAGRLRLDLNARVWASKILKEESISRMRARWLEYDTDDRYEVWQNSMLYVLGFADEQALRYLVATCTPGLLPAQYVADALDAIVRIKTSNGTPQSTASWHKKLWIALRTLKIRLGVSSFPASQRTLAFLISQSDPKYLPLIYQNLLDANMDIHPPALLRIASYAVNNGQPELAINALSRAASAGADMESNTFRNVCAEVLRKSASISGASRAGTRMVAMLLNHRIHPDAPMYNILMLNAIEEGDAETAWRIYQMLLKNKFASSNFTDTILLKASRRHERRILWSTRRRELIAGVRQRGLQNPSMELATELLVSAKGLPRRRSPRIKKDTFHVALDLYRIFWSIGPLVDLNIVDEHSRASSRNLQPPAPALGVVVNAFIVSAKVEVVWDLYRRFLELRQLHHPSIMSLASWDNIWNYFLKFQCGRGKGSSDQWRDLLRDMSSPPSRINNEPTDKNSGYCQPTSTTFSILVGAFAQHGDVYSAEQTILYMKRHNMSPSLEAWNALLRAYAREQYEKVADVLERMVLGGHRLDSATARALEPINDVKILIKGMLTVKEAVSSRQWRRQIVWRKLIERKIKLIVENAAKHTHPD